MRKITVGDRVLMTRFAYHGITTEEDGSYAEREVLRVRDYRLTQVPQPNSCVKLGVYYAIQTRRKEEKLACVDVESCLRPHRPVQRSSPRSCSRRWWRGT